MEKVRVIQGSPSDAEQANKLLKVLRKLEVPYQVSVASCHRNAGNGTQKLDPFIERIEERLIAFIGGMSLAAPGIIRSTLIALGAMKKIVVGIPLDAAARSAIEDLPLGCPVLTCGLNTVSVSHSITNSALALAHLAIESEEDVRRLTEWYIANEVEKALEEEVQLDEGGLIPVKSKEGK